MTGPGPAAGVVAAFDVEVGLGTIRADDGRELGFHCTQIADGSRRIDVGTPVAFDLLAGRSGRWEAAALRPTGPSGGTDGGAP